MPRLRQPGTLRTLAKRAILCLLLGAVLQYLVAVGFGLCPAAVLTPRSSWIFTVSDGPMKAGFAVSEHRAFGRVVLHGQLVLMQFELPQPPAKPDWSRGEWSNEFLDESAEPRNGRVQHQPASWSRFLTIGTDPDFDYFAVPNWQGFNTTFGFGGGWSIEVGCGWPMQSASYFAGLSSMAAPHVVREGVVISASTTATTEFPRVVPLRIYWTGALINTLVYTAVLLVPSALVPAIRQHLRRRAGRCIACGYDLRGAPHPVCPECGAAHDRAHRSTP